MIFLIADPFEMVELRDTLSCSGNYKIATGTFKRLIQNFANPKELRIVGYSCEITNDQKCEELTQIRTAFPHVKIMLFTSQVVITTYQALLKIKDLFIYQRNSAAERIRGIVVDVMTKANILPHVNERFFTNLPIRITVIRTGQFMESFLRSYSASDAFIEYKGISIQRGDCLHLGLLNEAEQNILQVKAVVVELTTKTFEVPKKGIEVRLLFS